MYEWHVRRTKKYEKLDADKREEFVQQKLSEWRGRRAVARDQLKSNQVSAEDGDDVLSVSSDDDQHPGETTQDYLQRLTAKAARFEKNEEAQRMELEALLGSDDESFDERQEMKELRREEQAAEPRNNTERMFLAEAALIEGANQQDYLASEGEESERAKDEEDSENECRGDKSYAARVVPSLRAKDEEASDTDPN